MNAENENFAENIEAAAGEESIQAVVVGHQSYSWPVEMRPHPPKELFGKVLTWEEARPWLDRSYYSGFGGAECWPVYAWTATRVIFVTEYDGSTGVHWVPRAPKECLPVFDGEVLEDWR